MKEAARPVGWEQKILQEGQQELKELAGLAVTAKQVERVSEQLGQEATPSSAPRSVCRIGRGRSRLQNNCRPTVEAFGHALDGAESQCHSCPALPGPK